MNNLSKDRTLNNLLNNVRKNKGSIKLAILFISCVTLSLILLLSPTKVATQTEDNPFKIGVSQTPLSAPFIIAEHLSLFEKANLDVELIACFGGVECSEALINDQVDFATASESVVMFKSYQTHDIALLTSFVQSSNDLKLLTLNENLTIKESVSISTESSNSNNSNLRKVGIVKGSASEYYFDTLLVAQGGNKRDIEKVYLSPKALVDALITRQVDAISIWEPYGYQVKMLTNNTITNLGIQGIYQLSFNLISKKSYFSPSTTTKTAQTAVIIDVLEQAIQWINQHPETAMVIVAKHLDVPLNQIKWSWNDYIFRLSIGNSLLSSLQTQSHWAKQQGLVKGKEPEFRDVIYKQPFEQAKSSKEVSW